MSSSERSTSTSYTGAGVDTDREEAGLARLIRQIATTWPPSGVVGGVELPIGYFANVVNLGPFGLAITADGVGTKLVVAQLLGRYDTLGIDCVAMNVNDLLCVGATPLTMVDYIAVDDADPVLLEELAKGLCEGARQANISIPGGEIAQLRDLLKGYGDRPAFDLAGMAVGLVPLDRIVIGRDLQPGDVVIGLESNGIHSNGVTLARKVLFEQHGLAPDARLPGLRGTVGEELLRPTHIYVPEVVDVLRQVQDVRALIHLTSDGFFNLTRVDRDVGYVIDALPPEPPIFSLIRQYGDVSYAEMFRVYNMGVGFCIVVPPAAVDRVFSVMRAHGRAAFRIGHVVADTQRRVSIVPHRLTGSGREKRFAEGA
jgi:phosphoribosylformylglycinamidine cyclo-ligase